MRACSDVVERKNEEEIPERDPRGKTRQEDRLMETKTSPMLLESRCHERQSGVNRESTRSLLLPGRLRVLERPRREGAARWKLDHALCSEGRCGPESQTSSANKADQ